MFTNSFSLGYDFHVWMTLRITQGTVEVTPDVELFQYI